MSFEDPFPIKITSMECILIKGCSLNFLCRFLYILGLFLIIKLNIQRVISKLLRLFFHLRNLIFSKGTNV